MSKKACDIRYRTGGGVRPTLRGAGYFRKVSGDQSYESRRFEDCLLIFVLEGRGRFVREGESFVVEKGDCLFLDPRMHYGLLPDEGEVWRECVARFSPQMRDDLGSYGIGFPEQPVTRVRHRSIESYERAVLESYKFLGDISRGAGLKLFEIAIRLLWWVADEARTSSLGDDESRRLDLAARRLGRPDVEVVSVETVAADFGFGFESFRKKFRAVYGCSPHRYRINKRMEFACSLLASSHISVQRVADELGYSDGFAFSRQFKKSMGVSPLAFQRQLK